MDGSHGQQMGGSSFTVPPTPLQCSSGGAAYCGSQTVSGPYASDHHAGVPQQHARAPSMRPATYKRSQACDTCREKKVKCSGGNPGACENCEAMKRDCVWAPTKHGVEGQAHDPRRPPNFEDEALEAVKALMSQSKALTEQTEQMDKRLATIESRCTKRTRRESESPISTTDRPRKRPRGTEPVDPGRGVGSCGHDESSHHPSARLSATQALVNVLGVEHDGTKWPAPGGNAENPLHLAGCRHAADWPSYSSAPGDMPAPDSRRCFDVSSMAAFGEGAWPQLSQEGGGVYDGQGARDVYWPHDFQLDVLDEPAVPLQYYYGFS